MKKKDFDKLLPEDKKAVAALIRDQSGAVFGIRSDKKKGFTDLPLFSQSDPQTKLFWAMDERTKDAVSCFLFGAFWVAFACIMAILSSPSDL